MHLSSVVVVTLALAVATSSRLTVNSVQAKTENLTSLTSNADRPITKTNAYSSHPSTLSVYPQYLTAVLLNNNVTILTASRRHS